MAETANHTQIIHPYRRPGVIIGAVIGGIFLLGIAFILGIGAGRWPNYGDMHGGRYGGYMMRGGDMHGMGGGTSTQNRFLGTVTAVNGSSFTLAGGGSNITVQTDSSTQWRGGNSVKVNDTAVAWGTINNGTLTATEVSINP